MASLLGNSDHLWHDKLLFFYSFLFPIYHTHPQSAIIMLIRLLQIPILWLIILYLKIFIISKDITVKVPIFLCKWLIKKLNGTLKYKNMKIQTRYRKRKHGIPQLLKISMKKKNNKIFLHYIVSMLYFRGVKATTYNDQGFLLALCTRITPGLTSVSYEVPGI